MHFALQKQEKVWEKRLHKLRATCQDQIKDVSCNVSMILKLFYNNLICLKSMGKLQILEDSLLEITEGKDHSYHQAAWSQELKSFHEVLFVYSKWHCHKLSLLNTPC